MKVYFDASVIVASLLSASGGSSLLFKFIKKGMISGFTSQTVLQEILEEKKYFKFRKSKKEIEDFIAQSGLVVREKISEDEIRQYEGKIDKEDAHLIAGAVQTKCQYLVSLDKKHVLKEEVRKKFPHLKILSPKELLQAIVK
ncbi:putative toxin-antitoxin system toxin component, PIN family [Candidatus Gottesmanbacteria bacterium RIFCSPLOWO2_02_FULL_42_29]|uniref:PIN domain-containing protein n=2 Tax=Candidatus Gottesmaniibacteriota TaxID=1752720 RepID=A0A0G0ZEL5_9BACT|nr:MAG: hypothetical protein UV09_C0008G0041 [Candidatus Gottesmanbacteria bacterium GW2011_GWA2_42_18]OGG10713.1 MAG: putative toxin-antitoxin system toxin component, PIN family [Candidatus Gottesmanbacteria bacterium RIFCSPHIGHO2_01_FULL_42_27]OGG20145.1 MAG: putative toxin-antitoxin system toxin component, PIN family [Candidatus Gottesmanbacteria bacterium RIFCSPHIGHO2_12_FULL_43_26]OGG34312.1 MAG: putative toxin-antitoxin system toxin component, PIN family [Candidatus Gottesmanbacteria bacte